MNNKDWKYWCQHIHRIKGTGGVYWNSNNKHLNREEMKEFEAARKAYLLNLEPKMVTKVEGGNNEN